MSALVIGDSRTRIALSIVRGLAARGVTVYTADHLKFTRCGFSRFSSKHFTYALPDTDGARFADDLRRIVRETGARVLLPAHDDLYYWIAENRHLFSGMNFIPMPAHDLIAQVKDKDRLMCLAHKFNMVTPKTMLLHSPEELGEAWDRFARPLVVKPVNRSSGKNIIFLQNKDHLLKSVSRIKRIYRGEKLIIQEYIDGDAQGAAFIFNNGNPVRSISYRMIHQNPPFGGTPTLAESVSNPEVVAILRELLVSLQWHGVCQADFIVDKKAGKTYILDINPRFYGSIFLTVAAGINFPYVLYNLALHKVPNDEAALCEKSTILWIEGEIARAMNCLKDKRFKELRIKDLAGTTHFEDFAFSDFNPLLLSPLCLLYKICRCGIERQRTN